VGSRPRKEELAYIAGFLDGDGSLMLQIKRRKDRKIGWRFMSTICFYQDSRHSKPLSWIRSKLGIGYLSDRNDGMTELRINGFEQTKNILGMLLPYIQFKKIQATALLGAVKILSSKKFKNLEENDFKAIARAIETIRKENYQSGKKDNKNKLDEFLGLTPYRLIPKG